MQKTSTKRIFGYFSLAFLLGYVVFVLLMYNAKWLNKLYDLKESGLYYIIIYVLLATVSYAIDTQTKKEPGYLTCLYFPIYTLVFLLSIMIMAGVKTIFLLLVVAAMLGILVLGYFVYKRWIQKIMLIKKGYENILLIYVIIHLFISLFISFKIIGLL